MKKIVFSVVYVDQWKTEYVACPVCELPYKIDGIIKHIQTSARNGGENHREWLIKNGPPRDIDPLIHSHLVRKMEE